LFAQRPLDRFALGLYRALLIPLSPLAIARFALQRHALLIKSARLLQAYGMTLFGILQAAVGKSS
jgi:hypothetical protein